MRYSFDWKYLNKFINIKFIIIIIYLFMMDDLIENLKSKDL
jgi:hypothetical protein